MSPSRPPRLVVRTLAFTSATSAALLVAMFVMMTIDFSARVGAAAKEKLQTAERIIASNQRERYDASKRWLGSVAGSAAFRAAWPLRDGSPIVEGPDGHGAALDSLRRELERVAQLISADIVVAVSPQLEVLASAGKTAGSWRAGQRLEFEGRGDGLDGIVRSDGGLFRVAGVSLNFGGHTVGALLVGDRLGAEQLGQMHSDARTRGLVVGYGGRVVASSFDKRHWEDIEPVLIGGAGEGLVAIDGEKHAYKKLDQIGRMSIYGFESVALLKALLAPEAYQPLAYIGLIALVLAGVTSVWLARTLARPINQLSRALNAIEGSGEVHRKLTPTGSSLELDSLITTFNGLIESLTEAEDETRAAYLGAIRALATALDARDPYTAGHSERVSALSISIGRHMGLPPEELEVLRLGALLHDIGKIGISDAVLRKAGPLTPEEFEIIKLHPTLGARILKSVRFLQPHLPIVELHHERPDGKGYPHGLRSEEIPLGARIVHVADAFDAITSARAYRPGRQTTDAVAEIWRHRGTEFDTEVAEALVAVLPNIRLDREREEPLMAPPAARPALVVPFERAQHLRTG